MELPLMVTTTPACSHPSWIQKSSDGMLQTITYVCSRCGFKQYETPNRGSIVKDIYFKFKEKEKTMSLPRNQDGTLNEAALAQEVARYAKGADEANIAETAQILKIVLDILSREKDLDILQLIDKHRKNQ